MALSAPARTTTGVLSNADATFLAASSAVDRYLKSAHFVNATAAPVTVNLGVGATLTGATGAIAFGKTILANDRLDIYFGGDGIKVSNTIIRAFASAASAVNLQLVYNELPV